MGSVLKTLAHTKSNKPTNSTSSVTDTKLKYGHEVGLLMQRYADLHLKFAGQIGGNDRGAGGG